MKFMFAVEIEVKNDALTQDCGSHEMALMLLNCLEDNMLDRLPWVIQQHYGFINTKE